MTFVSCLSCFGAPSQVVFVPTGEADKCLLVNSLVSILQESYRQVMKMRPKDLWKRLMVKFRGEEGLDYGGVAR